MANVKVSYTTVGTMTLSSPASSGSAARESTAIDNSSNLYVDYLVRHKFVAGTVTGNKQVICYVYGSEDGTNYESVATGSDAAITLRSPESLNVAKVIPTPTSSVTYQVTYSVAQCWGGIMPKKFGVIMVDDGASTSTSVSFSAITSDVTGVFYTVV